MKRIIYLLIIVLGNCIPRFDEMKIGTNKWPGYEPLYLARHQGYFDSKPIHLVEFDSTSQVLRFFRNGLLNSGGVTVDEAIFLKDQNINPKIVMVMDISNGADVLIAKSTIKTPFDLKGKKVGVENTALGAYFLARILKNHNLTVHDIQVVHLEVQQHISAFESRVVDAVVTFSSFESQLLKMGGNKIFDSSMIPGEITDVLIVNENYLKKNKPIVKLLLRNWFKTIENKEFNSQKSIEFMAKRDGISKEDFISVTQKIVIPNLSDNHFLLTNSSSSMRKSWQGLVSQMLDSGLISQNLNFDDVVDAEIVNELFNEIK